MRVIQQCEKKSIPETELLKYICIAEEEEKKCGGIIFIYMLNLTFLDIKCIDFSNP